MTVKAVVTNSGHHFQSMQCLCKSRVGAYIR